MTGAREERGAVRPARGGEALRFERVSRRFLRRERRPATLKEAVVRRLRGDRPRAAEFWALRDVSLSVARGEVVGLCGANGAGKTTLLQVAAGILPPTAGRVVIRGRVAAMLELGSGFLPDLTGRENVLLNGALAGIDDRQMRGRLASIIEFAGLGRFIDSPVRCYSAGMYMRLGFAIAAHVDAELLLLDEVLAVGDAEFQRKCLQWLERRRGGDAAVLLVSHSLPLLERVCDRLVWLDRGGVAAVGDPGEVARSYTAGSQERPAPRPVAGVVGP